jgi:hypothetical protein
VCRGAVRSPPEAEPAEIAGRAEPGRTALLAVRRRSMAAAVIPGRFAAVAAGTAGTADGDGAG